MMAGVMMMKSEESTPSSFNFGLGSGSDHNNEVSEAKKVKLMYTSEFLKSFDKTPKPSTVISLEDLDCDNKKTVRSKDLHAEKLKEKLEMKDIQIQQLRYLVLKLKDLIGENKDEALVRRMRDILGENEEGRQLISSDQVKKKSVKIPPIKIPENEPTIDTSALISPVNSSVTPTSPTPVSPTGATNSKLSARSPRRKPAEPLSPTSAAIGGLSGGPVAPLQLPNQQPTQTQTQPQSQPQLPQLSTPTTPPGFLAALTSNSGTPSSSTATATTPKQVSLRSPRRNPAPPQPKAPPANSKNVMKRSPSMPVINNDRQKQDSTQAQLKLQKKTKSQEDASLDMKMKKGGPEDMKESAKKVKGPESLSPRKGIKKSVSMSAICTEDKDKANALKCTSLEEIVGQIYPLTKYQAGCRFLQKKLEEQPDPQHVTLVFNEVFDHLIELMTDPYGQYLVPKLMKYCDANQRQLIVTKIAPKIVTFACHTYGIHGVQKILEFLTDEQINTFIDVIRPNVILLAKDTKGNYLIQSFLKQFPSERNQFIFDAITENCVEVATHKVGCTLINRCLDYANEQQLSQLGHRVVNRCLDLVQDQYGNYVVQHLLTSRPSFTNHIIRGLLGHIPELSVQKFSSNVVEKCLQVAPADLYADVIKEITDANLLELLQDRYANFVIQTALDVADDVQHAKLVKLILPYIHQIKTPYVMHIQKKILQV